MHDFDVFARFYDLDFQHQDEDIEFYQNFAKRCGSPILEIGSGTGRVLIPLAQAGYDITGVDISAAMQDVARWKADVAGLRRHVNLVLADARKLALNETFNMAFVAINTFMHFVEQADQKDVLSSISRHLTGGGTLIIDIFNPATHVISETDGLLIHEYTRRLPETGETVTKVHTRRTDISRQTMEVEFLYDVIGADGLVRRTVAPFTSHYYTYSEMLLLLANAGYEVESVYGSYDLDEYTEDSSRMIFVAAKSNG